MIRHYGKGGSRYDAARPPVAALSWDGTAIYGDSAAVIFRDLVDRAEFRYSDEFWRVVPILYGRQIIRWNYERFRRMPRRIWELEPAYLGYRKKFISSYYDMCRQESRKACRVYLARLLTGLSEKEVSAEAIRAVQGEMRAPLLPRFVRDSPGDRSPLREETGLREVPEIRSLCLALRSAGFEVWVIASEAEWILRALVPAYGVLPDRAVGIRLAVKSGRLTSSVIEPVPFRSGKVAAIESRIGRRPVLAIGDSRADMEMLASAAALGVFLDRGDAKLRREAEKKGFVVQEAFAPALEGR